MPVIDLAFVLVGPTIPLDHGYSLFGALSRIVPALHGDKRIGVHPIRGIRTAPGVLSLTKDSRLRLRLPAEEIAPYIALAGTELDVDGHRLQVGIPSVESLAPAPNLAARLVTFRGALDPQAFETMVRDELNRLGVDATPRLVPSHDPRHKEEPTRRVVRIKRKQVIGYALRFDSLSPETSMTLQERGLGGRRRFGCGVFLPFLSAQ